MNARRPGAVAAAVVVLGLAAACSGDPAGTQSDSTASTGTDGAGVAAASGRGGAGSAGEEAGSGSEPPAVISDYGLYVIDVADGTVTTLVGGTSRNAVGVSPDGTRMVYSGETRYYANGQPPGMPDSTGVLDYSGFFVADVDGSDPVLLTDEWGWWEWPEMWFPDSSGVLYTTEDGLFAFSMEDYSSTKVSDQRPRTVVFSEGGNILHGNFDGLFVSALDGTAERRLAAFADEEWHEWRTNHRYEWYGWRIDPEAPTHVAFRAGNRLMLAAIDDPEDSRRLTDAAYRDFSYRWSPDGTKLGYVADENLYAAAVDSPEPMLLASGGVHSFEWSPDGSKVAYTAEDDPMGRPLYVVAADGGEPLRLSGQGFASRPGWSPDGSHVAYVVGNRSDSHRRGLFVSALDGSDWRLVAHATADEICSLYTYTPYYRWLRGGRKLLYATDFNADRCRGELAIYNLHTDTTTALTGAWRGRLKFSPDRGHFIYETGYSLHVVDTDRGHQTLVDASSDQHHNWLYSWSPDSRRLLHNDTDGWHILDADTGTKHNISDTLSGYQWWSPDGDRLAYATRRGVHLYDTATGHTQELATISQQVSSQGGFSGIFPGWIPDGSAITVTVNGTDYE